MNSASRMADIAPFHVMELMAKSQALERAGRSIIHLEVGEPDFPTAEPILEAAQRFLSGGHVHYTAALGLPALREAISEHYQSRYASHVSPDRIIITAGASGALLLALAALITPGDEWLLPDPGYPCNRNFVRLLEGLPQSLPVMAKTNYQPTSQQVAAAWSEKTRGLMLASPGNPTGTMLSKNQIAEIWTTVTQNSGTLLVDEIYHGLTYREPAHSATSVSDDIFVINSFSKYFGMTGWRLGWLVAPDRCVREIEKLAQNLYIAPSTVAQHAALAAFSPSSTEIFETRRREFSDRRDLLLPGLQRLGFSVAKEPQGAFYIYAGCEQLTDDSFRLAQDLLEHAGVAATPGLDFGTNQPATHMRFAYTSSQRAIAEGLERMANYLGSAHWQKHHSKKESAG